MEPELSPEAAAVLDDAAAVVEAVTALDPDLGAAVAAVVEDALALSDPPEAPPAEDEVAA